MDNYEKLIERISNSSNIEKEEIQRKVEAKRAKLSGLISKEGAAQIIAAELGLNLDQERLKLSEIVQGMKKANVVGKIISINPIREYNKNGREGKVASFLMADESGNARVVLWDTNHISLLEKKELKEEDVVEISGANVRNSELHLSSFSDIKKSKEKIESVVLEQRIPPKNLKESRPGETIKTRAIIVKTFEPKYFEVSPETGKKFTEADKNNGLRPEKRALLSFVLDDGTETMRSVAFGQDLEKLGLTKEQIFSPDEFNKTKDTLVGEEKIFSGNLRTNAIFQTTELTVSNIEEVNPDVLIKELEAK